MAERLTKKQRREQTQAKVAAMRAEQARKERRRRIFITVGAVLSVLVVVAGFVVVKLAVGDSNDKASSAGSTAASDAVVNAIGGLPQTTFDTVGVGSVQSLPKPLTGAPALTADGKPRVLYVGAEYCPFCAAERWAVTAALARFGSFSNLGATTSSSSDAYPNTATLSFHGATFTSPIVSFTGYETTDRDRKPLDTISEADQALVKKYDAPPYVSADSAGAIPFVNIGGKWVISGASFDPAVLKGKTQEQIAAAMEDPTTDISKAVLGTANVITAAICSASDDTPSNVCTSAGVRAAAAKLNAK